MMPDCTGLPPGELMRRITPCVLLSLKALCSAEVMRSAFASPRGSMTPTMSTSAVCLPPFRPSRLMRQSMASTTKKVMYAKVSSLKKMPQRRDRRCSLSASVASFSITPRSQSPPFSALASAFQINATAPLVDFDPRQRPRAGSAEAHAGVRCVKRAMCRAYQKQPFGIKDSARLPVQFHRHVLAAVEIGVDLSVVAHDERRHRLIAALHLEAHAVARIGERVTAADQAFSTNHRCSSAVLSTQAMGSSASSFSLGCAPCPTPSAATPALAG